MQLSIITINFNNASGLRRTMASVAAQTSRDFEYIIIDGGSTDGGMEVIESFAPIPAGRYIAEPAVSLSQSEMPPVTYWISEPDKGIYNAMNKGLRQARGDYVHFLNSGDWLADDQVVENMLEALRPDTDILVGEVISVRADGKVRYNKNKTDVGLSTFYGGTIQHTSAYIRRSLFDTYGFYDETLKIVADWKWYLIAAGLNNARIQFADIYVSFFDTTGISSTQLDQDKAERRQVLETVIPKPILSDYDRFYFHMIQIQRMKKSRWLYGLFWFAERCLFKIDKWRLKYFGWKNRSNHL
jgi:glycosyltransferase involved in cell wall biosynthesis